MGLPRQHTEDREGDDTFQVTKDSPTLPRRDRLRSTREISLASCEAEGDNTSLASCEARGRHPWPGRHTDGIQRAQPTLATDGGNRCLAPPHRHAQRLRRRGEQPWPGSTPLRLRSRGRQHFPGQTPTLHTCEAEGDNTSLARYYTVTSAKPRDDPGQTPHRHTATAHGSASQIKKIFRNIKPFSFVKDFFGGGEIIEFHFGTPLFHNCRRLQQRHHSDSEHHRNHC